MPRGAIGAEGLTFLRLHEDERQAELTAEDVEATELLLKQLADASLVQRRFDEERCEDLYDLHQVIVDFLQSKYTAELPELMKRVYEFYRAGSYISAPKSLEDLEPVLEAQHFALQLCNYNEAWQLLSWNLLNELQRWGHWSKSRDLLLQIVEYLEGSHKAHCIGWMGIVNHDSGNWDEAGRLLNKSLEMMEALGDRSGLATSWGIVGDLERNRGNWDEAECLYQKSLEMMEALADRSGMASSWGRLGDLEHNRGHWDEAERLYRKSLEVMETLGNRSGMAISWGQLGDIERNRGHWDEAERLFRKALGMMEELVDRSGVAYSYGSLGEVELGRRNFELAEQYLNDALQKFEQLNSPKGLAEVQFRLAQTHRAKGNPDLAQTHYTTAHRLFTQLGAAKDLERIEKEWAES